MKILNRKGSALLQVLVLSAVISTIVVVLLKFAITRTSNTIQTKYMVGTKLAMESCMSALNEEELRRLNEGRAPYFEENEEFPCALSNYSAFIRRKTSGVNATPVFSHSAGIVRPLEFTVTFYNPNTEEEEVTEEEVNP